MIFLMGTMINSEKLLTEANEILSTATPEQIKWVYARLVCKTDKEAAKQAGVHHVTVSQWPNKLGLNRAVSLLLRSPIEAALRILEDAAIEAAIIKTSGLKSKKEGIKQAAATEILDRNMGRPKQRQEFTGAEGGPIEIEDVSAREKLLGRLGSIAAREAEAGGGREPDG